ncbi:diguanylate cyclase [bacterium]|nr:diguanylate cyclase [bacterium]
MIHTVLVVEDETNNRFLLKTYLSSDGYKVQLAKNGEEALKMVAENPPSAIILDVLLPNMNGFEVCRKLKSSEVTSFIPVIMVTALHGNEERIKGIEVGADDFIQKPINRVELLTRIKSLLRIKRLHEALELKVNELEKAKTKLRKLAVTDGLTSLYNYRAFRQQLRQEISRSRRFNLPVSLLIMDFDHFKVYNDLFGHPNGDKVLKLFAKRVYQNIRDVDCLARYGGEEFVLILPGTDKKAAKTVAEKIRRLVEQTSFPHEEKLPDKRVTVSVGVASFPQDTDDEETLIKLTDKALYRAKKSGRNRVITI